MKIIAQLVGFLGIIISFIIYQQKDRKKLLVWKLVSDTVWMLHYALLGAYSAVAVTIIGVIRETVYLNEGKKWANKKFWIVIFCLINALFAFYTWKGLFSLLPTIASLIAVVSFAMRKPKITRFFSFPISFCMITYDFFTGSIAGIANETFTITSSIIGLIRHDIKK
ncbi:MAG: YgjV family protein [Clostridia bacterium]|nr:YgjV family protein [Clostridia bacterium]